MAHTISRAMLLVDVQNAYYTTRDAFGKHLNYNRLWSDIAQRYNIVHAFAYAIERHDAKQQCFQNILRNIGFEVKLKPFIQRQDGSAKGDWDVGLTVDALLYANDIDVVILVSGDGDFDILATTLKQHYQKRVEVYGVATLTANALIYAADQFIEIDQALLMP